MAQEVEPRFTFWAFFVPALVLAFSGCTYLGTVTKQTYLSTKSPQQRVYKHMLDRDTYFVFGKIKSPATGEFAVIAFSDKFSTGETVDINHATRGDSYYGLNLPEGEFQLVAVCDQNQDGFYDEHEVIGTRSVAIHRETAPEKVLGGCDISANAPDTPALPPFHVAATHAAPTVESVFFPKGTIRSLNDPIFSPEMASLGMYEPAAFLEAAPMMFYALEEDVGYKIPVVFVHGIDGSARDFEKIIAQLDRRYYRPWFFHYPSGMDLSQLSAMFYRLFLSGNVIPVQGTPMVIVAHSMGGLVVRDAFNRCTGRKSENPVACLITIASPLGGHPAAQGGLRAPVVIPSWKDLAPSSKFIHELHRRPLPSQTKYHLYYTFGNTSTIKLGENSDGTVPLSSQCDVAAQSEASEQFGFNDNHTGVLQNPEAIRHVIKTIETVKPSIPDDHLRVLLTGGFEVTDATGYTPLEAHLIRTIGHYMNALVAGELKPTFPGQEHFIAACRGQTTPNQPAEFAWLKYNKTRVTPVNTP